MCPDILFTKKSRYTKQTQDQLANIGKRLTVPIESQTVEIEPVL